MQDERGELYDMEKEEQLLSLLAESPDFATTVELSNYLNYMILYIGISKQEVAKLYAPLLKNMTLKGKIRLFRNIKATHKSLFPDPAIRKTAMRLIEEIKQGTVEE